MIKNLFIRSCKGLLCIIIIIVHVHIFAYTHENPFNPLLLVHWLSVFPPYWETLDHMLSVLIPGLVTIGAACIILKWKKWRIWGASLLICMYIRIIVYNHLSLIPVLSPKLEEIYSSFYHYLSAFHEITIDITIHICLLLIYYVLCQLNRKIKHRSLISPCD